MIDLPLGSTVADMQQALEVGGLEVIISDANNLVLLPGTILDQETVYSCITSNPLGEFRLALLAGIANPAYGAGDARLLDEIPQLNRRDITVSQDGYDIHLSDTLRLEQRGTNLRLLRNGNFMLSIWDKQIIPRILTALVNIGAQIPAWEHRFDD
jgi:hypothetical protein